MLIKLIVANWQTNVKSARMAPLLLASLKRRRSFSSLFAILCSSRVLKYRAKVQDEEIAKLHDELKQAQSATCEAREVLFEEVVYLQNLLKTVTDIRKVPERCGLTSLMQRGNLQLRRKSTVVRGLEYSLPNARTRVMEFDMIYPLRKMSFCGYQMSAPHRPEAFLRLAYGEYGDFPRDIYPKHDDINARINEDTIKTVERIVEGTERIVI